MGNTGTVSATMAVLLGGVTASGRVDVFCSFSPRGLQLCLFCRRHACLYSRKPERLSPIVRPGRLRLKMFAADTSVLARFSIVVITWRFSNRPDEATRIYENEPFYLRDSARHSERAAICDQPCDDRPLAKSRGGLEPRGGQQKASANAPWA